MDRRFILGLLATIVRVSTDSYHPREIICRKEGLQHDPENCQRFYWCNLNQSGLTPLQLECDRDLIFDIDSQICTYPVLTTREECKEDIISNEVDSGRFNNFEFKSNSQGCTQEGFISDDQDCQKFYRCVAGNGKESFEKYEFSCGDDTVYDPDISGCNHAWAVKNEKCRTGFQIATEETNESIYPNYPSSESTGGQHNYDNIDNPNHNINPDTGSYPPISVNGQNNDDNYDANYGSIQSSPRPVSQTEKPTTSQPLISQPSQTTTAQILEQSSTTETTKNKNDLNPKNDCQYEGFLADFKDCKKFYRCVPHAKGFTKYEFICGQGTAWDSEIENCNYPTAIKSRDCAKSIEAEVSSTESSGSMQSSSEAIIISQTTAVVQSNSTNKRKETTIPISSFYSSTTPTALITESTTPNQKENTTVSSMTLEGSQSTTQSNKEPTSISPGTKCTQEGFMGDPNDCKKFYRCVNDGKAGFTKYEFTCGDGAVWDSDISSCNYPWAIKNIKCGTGGQSIANTTDSNEIDSSGTSEGQQPIASSTITTVDQTSSISIESSSASNPTQPSPNESSPTIPSPTEASPIDPSLIELNSTEPNTESISSSSSPSEPNASESTTKNSNTKPGQVCTGEHFLSDPKDCQKFYRCVNDGRGGFITYEFNCGEGTVWDSESDICNYQSAAIESCGKGNANAQATTQSSSDEETTSSDKGELNNNELSSTTDQSAIASQFYEGSSTASANERPTSEIHIFETTTSEKEQFFTEIPKSTSSVAQSSDITISSETSNSESTTTEAPKSTFASLIIDSCNQEGFIGDSKDCKKFYRCVNNGQRGFIKYEFACSKGTVWDSDQSTCNYPWAVKSSCNNLSSNGNEIEYKDETTNSSIDLTTQSGTITSGQSSESVDPSSSSENVDASTQRTTTLSGQSTETSSSSKNTDSMNLSAQSSEVTTVSKHLTSSNSPSTEPNQSITEFGQTPISESNHSTQSNIGAIGTKCKQEGFLDDSQDCKKFYRCVDNGKGSFTKYEFACGDGTVWDSKLTTCNYASAVKDQNCGTAKPDSFTTEYPLSQVTNEGTSENTTASEAKTDLPEISSSTEQSNIITPEATTISKLTTFTPESTTISEQSTPIQSVQSEPATTPSQPVTEEAITVTPEPFQTDQPITTAELNTIQTDASTKISDSSTSSTEATNTPASSATESNVASSIETSSTPASQTTESTAPVMLNTENTCTQEGFIPNLQDCKKFIRCVGNGKGGFTKYDFSCGEETIWDPDLDTCNWPNAVQDKKCEPGQQSGGQGSSISEPEESSTSIEIGQSTTVKPSSSNTSEPENTTTSKPNGQSNISKPGGPETGTSNTTKPSTPNEQSTSRPQVNKCISEGFFPNSKDCQKFYRCVGNGKGSYTKYDFSCGEGTIWDPNLDTCNYPSVVENKACGGGQSSEPTTEKESKTDAPATTTSETTTQLSETTSELSETTAEAFLTTTDAATDSETELTTSSAETTTQALETSTTDSGSEATTSGIATTTSEIDTTSTNVETTTTNVEITTANVETTTSGVETSTFDVTTNSEVAITDPQVDWTTTEFSETTTVSETTQGQETTSQQQTTTDAVTDSSTDSSLTTIETGETSTNRVETTTDEVQTTTDGIQTTEVPSTTDSNTEITKIPQTTNSQTDGTDSPTEVTTSTTDSGDLSTDPTPTAQSTSKPDSNQTAPCPISQLEGDQVSLVCPTGFKQHPKYCNLFYQCTTNSETFDIKVLVLSCPNNTIYDDTKIQCLAHGETEQQCTGQLAEKKNYRRSNENHISPMIIESERPLCPAEGSYPLDPNECDPNFIKCEQSMKRTMRGFVYQCPENFIYWPISRRCEPQSKALGCVTNQVHKIKWQIPTEEVNVALRATVVYQ